MTQGDFGVALLLFVGALPMQLWRFRRLHGERLKTDRYALFAVRDHWIRLVADGHLKENDELFQFLYQEINGIIPKAKPLTLRNVVAALKDSRVINDNEFTQKWLQLLKHGDKEVRQVSHEFFMALMNILVGRSVFLKLSILVTHSGVQVFSAVRKALSHILKTESEAYRIHNKLRDLCLG